MNNHKNARLTVHGRSLLVRRVVEDGLRPAEAAQAVGVSVRTAYKWLRRYHEQGEAGLMNRSSRPLQCPHATPGKITRRVIKLRHQRQTYRQIALASYLRPSNIDPTRHSWAILSLLVKALRRHWPKVEIIFRGDSGFYRWKQLRWCDRNDVCYIVGCAKNQRLEHQSSVWMELAASQYRMTGRKQRVFASVYYGARTWDQPRWIIVKAEHSSHGANPHFLVTNLAQTDKYLYDKVYCARGDIRCV